MMNKKLRIGKPLIYLFLSIAVVMYIFPFFLIILKSFKSNGEILENPFSFPKTLNFGHFAEVIEKMNFKTTFVNSAIISVTSIALILLFSSMCAYWLVRNRNKFNNTFFLVLVAAMIIPFQSLMIPLIYIYGARLGLIQSMPIPLLIFLYAGFGSPMSVFIYHGFIKTIPIELEEASRIDGCSRIQTFFKIVLPMLKPTSVSLLILNALWIWSDYLLPSLILRQEQFYTMPIKMKVFNGTYMNNWELLIPALLLTILPLLVVYFIAQKSIIEGVTQGSVKG